MEYYDCTASIFAEKIGVQRSSISHILSGRNKPSLDFILKITGAFNEVDMQWLVSGKGAFPTLESHAPTPTTPNLFQQRSTTDEGKKIQRIVVFYTDGTFDEFTK